MKVTLHPSMVLYWTLLLTINLFILDRAKIKSTPIQQIQKKRVCKALKKEEQCNPITLLMSYNCLISIYFLFQILILIHLFISLSYNSMLFCVASQHPL
jgi:hypothetical protein